MSIYDIAVKNYDGSNYLLKRYKGKVLIIVNTATNCTLNDQFNKLEMLYKKYHKYGLEILSFPCNDFNNQEPELIKDINISLVLLSPSMLRLMLMESMNTLCTHY